MKSRDTADAAGTLLVHGSEAAAAGLSQGCNSPLSRSMRRPPAFTSSGGTLSLAPINLQLCGPAPPAAVNLSNPFTPTPAVLQPCASPAEQPGTLSW